MSKRAAKELGLLLAIVIVAIAMVRETRHRLWSGHALVKERHDPYLLPPAEHLPALSLGYRSALADLLWAHLLVEQGQFLTRRQRYANVGRYFEAINTLDPTWRTPYLLAEPIITLQTEAIIFDDVLTTREVLERGVKNRPFDAEIRLILGQFLAYVAPPSYLEDKPELAQQWQQEGARALATAAELGAGDDRIVWGALGGINMLEQSGHREETIRFYQQQYAASDDPELRRDIQRRLEKLIGEEEVQRSLARHQELDRLRTDELPWIHADTLRVLGPLPRPARCAGPGHDADPDCATTWRAWHDRWQPR